MHTTARCYFSPMRSPFRSMSHQSIRDTLSLPQFNCALHAHPVAHCGLRHWSPALSLSPAVTETAPTTAARECQEPLRRTAHARSSNPLEGWSVTSYRLHSASAHQTMGVARFCCSRGASETAAYLLLRRSAASALPPPPRRTAVACCAPPLYRHAFVWTAPLCRCFGLCLCSSAPPAWSPGLRLQLSPQPHWYERVRCAGGRK